jgi:phosphoglycolate phosphatase
VKLKNKKLIIFDLDGTLIDSGADLADALNHTLTKLSLKTYDEATIHEWVGNGAQTLVKRALLGKRDVDAHSVDAQLFHDALEIFLDYYEKNVCVRTKMFPNVDTSLKQLKDSGYKMSIVTNKPYAFIGPILTKLGISELFDLYIGADSLSKKKPDPEPLFYVCDKLGINIQDSVMVGDSKNDIIAANNAQMHSIGVSYGYNYGESIEKYKPSLVINDFKDILEVLEDER